MPAARARAVGDSPHGDDDTYLPRGVRLAPGALVIRNVVVGRLRPAADPAQRAADAALLREGLEGIAALRFPGLVAMSVGCDLGLREGGWSFAITNDWQDAAAYRVYDEDEEHNRLRREIFAVICQDIARVQFQVDS
jgi:Stress responsive A/B Barrel Domain